MANYPKSENWKTYRPSKTLWFWSSVGIVIATMIIGFSWGGWVSGSTARFLAADAAKDARAQLVASVCVQRYVSGDRFASRLATLKEASSWDREDLIAKGTWTDLPGIEEPVANAADLCASRLAEMDAPETPVSETTETASKTSSTS